MIEVVETIPKPPQKRILVTIVMGKEGIEVRGLADIELNDF